MINVMHDLIVRIFEHLDITSKLELYLRVKYTERIISNAYLKKYRQVLLVRKEKDIGVADKKWIPKADKNFIMDQIWA